MKTLDPFQASLLNELRTAVEERNAAQHRRSRRRKLAIGSIATAASAAVGLNALVSSPAAAAFTVTRQADGDVVVEVHRHEDAAGLEQALRAEGLNAEVGYLGEAGYLGETGIDTGQGEPMADPNTFLLPSRDDMPDGAPVLTSEDCFSLPAPRVEPGGLGATLTIPAEIVRLGENVRITSGAGLTHDLVVSIGNRNSMCTTRTGTGWDAHWAFAHPRTAEDLDTWTAEAAPASVPTEAAAPEQDAAGER